MPGIQYDDDAQTKYLVYKNDNYIFPEISCKGLLVDPF